MAAKLTGTPAHCSACFNQDPSLQHVDLDAAWDGPVLDQGNGMKQVIDDLVLCETCLGEAARLLGYVPASDDKTAVRLERLEAELAESRRARADIAGRFELVRRGLAEIDPEVAAAPRRAPTRKASA